jgi:RimJ/RimL family protein N-acetyltransferase
VQEGVLREHDVDELGRVCDDVVYSLLRREWRRA